MSEPIDEPEVSPTDVTLFSHPKLALSTLFDVIVEKLKELAAFSKKHWLILTIVTGLIYCLYAFPALHKPRELIYFALYWILLGVASSIGLGTGLHTFVLYLGPHIAKVAMTATECGYVPDMVPSRWAFDHFKECTQPKTSEVSFLTILLAVQIEAFLWGFGTALGELPPYFIARHAAQVSAKLKQVEQTHQKKLQENKTSEQELEKEQLEELELKLEVSEVEEEHEQLKEIQKLEHLKPSGSLPLIERLKLLIFHMLQKYGFITVLLCASIPNPLFDLAGITCGHFRIPFTTFFSATFIGKAIIKVHLQMLFVITLFRKETVELVLRKFQQWIPSLQNSLIDSLEKQKKLLFAPETFTDSKPLVSRLWDFFLIGMILYFVMSILNTSIQHQLVEIKMKKTLSRRNSLKLSAKSSTKDG